MDKVVPRLAAPFSLNGKGLSKEVLKVEKEGREHLRIRGMEGQSEERVNVVVPQGFPPEGIEGTGGPMIGLVETVSRDGAIRVVKGHVKGA